MLIDKLHPSSARTRARFFWTLLSYGLFVCASPLPAITLSQAEANRIGRKIWQNECNGTVSGLTAWNVGEDFASLGIGHFIWYPEGQPGPFEESFPRLVAFVASHGAKLPPLLLGTEESHCPWKSRGDFVRAQQSPEMKQLRQFLVDTIDLQTQFLIDRLQNALPKMLNETAPAQRSHIEQQFQGMAATASGCYALIDYVNFKGEGVLHTERYNGQGWGLLQALEEMQDRGDADTVKEFSRAAAAVLKRRVANSPSERHESRWLPGWINRVNSYSRR